MKHLFIINPAAGSHDRTEEYSRIIHKLCRKKGLSYEIRVSSAPGEATRMAREAAQTGEEVKIPAGKSPVFKAAKSLKDAVNH